MLRVPNIAIADSYKQDSLALTLRGITDHGPPSLSDFSTRSRRMIGGGLTWCSPSPPPLQTRHSQGVWFLGKGTPPPPHSLQTRPIWGEKGRATWLGLPTASGYDKPYQPFPARQGLNRTYLPPSLIRITDKKWKPDIETSLHRVNEYTCILILKKHHHQSHFSAGNLASG